MSAFVYANKKNLPEKNTNIVWQYKSNVFILNTNELIEMTMNALSKSFVC